LIAFSLGGQSLLALPFELIGTLFELRETLFEFALFVL